MLFHKFEQLGLRLGIFPTGTSFIHIRTGSHVEQRLLNVIALISCHQHSKPEVIILQKIEILIGANCLDCGFLIHHAGVIKRIALLCKLYDFRICLGRHTPCIDGVRISSKLLHDTGANTHLRMCVKHSDLFFTSIRISDVIAVHPGNQFILAVLDALVQSIAEAAVLCQPNNVQSVAHLLLLCCNHGIQLRIQRSIAHQHKIVCWNRLHLNAFDCLSQIFRLFFVINSH